MMNKLSIYVAAVVITHGIASASDFASVLVSSQGSFGASPYDDPMSVLGAPTTKVYDTWGGGLIFNVSLVYAAWNVTPEGQKTVLTLPDSSRHVVVGFDHKVADDINNPYGIDFIVFSNTFFQRQSGVHLTPTTDMGSVLLTNPAVINEEWVTVSVAQSAAGPWYTFPEGVVAGDLFPTNPFVWDSVNKTWGQLLDFLKPVNPALTRADFSGLSVPQAIELYGGSAGGAGFDLQWLAPADYAALETDPVSGRKWIQYIKFTGDDAGEIDAVSDVAACGDYKYPFPLGDLNYDCRVDMDDVVMLSLYWAADGIPSFWMPELTNVSENWLDCTWDCD